MDIDSDTSSSSDESDESGSDEESDDSDEESDNENNANPSTTTTVASTTVAPQMKRGPHSHFSRHLANLKRVPAGTSVGEHVATLKERLVQKSRLHRRWKFQKNKLNLAVPQQH